MSRARRTETTVRMARMRIAKAFRSGKHPRTDRSLARDLDLVHGTSMERRYHGAEGTNGGSK